VTLLCSPRYRSRTIHAGSVGSDEGGAANSCGRSELGGGGAVLLRVYWDKYIHVRLVGSTRLAIFTFGWIDEISHFYSPVYLAYNPSFSACFFSRNNIFLSQKISQQCFSAGL
jgi:hypothetical protein